MIGLPLPQQTTSCSPSTTTEEDYQEISLLSEKRPIPSTSARIVRALTMPFRSSSIQSRLMETTRPADCERPSLDNSFLNLPSAFHSSSSSTFSLCSGDRTHSRSLSASKAWLRTLSSIRESKETDEGEGGYGVNGEGRDVEALREERRRRLRLLSEILALFALGAGLVVMVVLCSSGVMKRHGGPVNGVVKVYPPSRRGGMGH